MSITLNQFKAVSLQNTGRLTVTEDHQVRSKGTGLGRLVEWFKSKTNDGRDARNLLNTKTKDAFVTAIRIEFGDAMAKQAGHELGNHKSLKGRTVIRLLQHAEEHRETFVKQHNISRTANIHKEIQATLDKHDGIKKFYENKDGNQNASVAGMFKFSTGFSQPPFDPKMTGYLKKIMFDKQLDTALANSKNGMLGHQSFTINEVKQNLNEAAMLDLWLNKGGMSEAQMNEFFSNDPVTTKQALNLLDSAKKTIEKHPEFKNSIVSNLNTFFSKASSLKHPSVTEALVANGISHGLLDPSIPGVGLAYEQTAAKHTGGSRIKMLCLAEKCYTLAGDLESAVKTRTSILDEQKKHISQGTGLGLNKIQLPTTEEDRTRLGNLRKELTPSASETSQKLRSFVADIYKECLAHFGVNEDDQSMVMFGSGSRDEMFPFSDLEFAVLTKSNSGNEKLHQAITLFEMRITALGETPEGQDKSIPIREGLCMDPGGNCPKGSDKSFVGTPKTIAGKLAGDLILVEVFSAVKVLVGNSELSKQYNQEVENYFKFKAGGKITKGQDFAIQNLTDQVKEMRDNDSPIVSTDHSNLQKIDAKKLTRFPFFVASSLCKFHGVSPAVTNTVDRLNALKELGVLTSEETTALVDAFNGFGDLRLEAEMHYGGQVHTILKDDDGQSHFLGVEKWQDMLKLLEPLNSIFAKVERFTQNPNSEFQVK